ncbi:MAG: MOSC domain-containing protein [Nitrospirota bacterium]
MIIKSLNIGKPKQELFYGKAFLTGMCKQPVRGEIALSRHGFEGEGVGDSRHHGGEDKAVCVYSLDHYPYWRSALDSEMPAAAFGENLSVEKLQEDEICIGDRYRIGTALVQVSQPRQPCTTLAARYNREDLIKLVRDSGRTGFYFRVMTEGRVQTGDNLVLIERDSRGVTVSYANSIFYHDRSNCAGLERVLAVPALSDSWKRSFRELLERSR